MGGSRCRSDESHANDGCRRLTAEWKSETALHVSFDVTNIGNLKGAEAAQVYIHPCVSEVDRPEMELAAFAKATLAPGESKRLLVALDVSTICFLEP
jgi:beta-glucosidase